MDQLALNHEIGALPAMVERAARALAEAHSAAEILDARDRASVIYDAAKSQARLIKIRGAHDTLLTAAHRVQADALEIEAGAKRRLADEYDAAQERGEVATSHDGKFGRSEPERLKPTAADIGLTRKDIHEARQVRDAEAADPGIVRRVLDERLQAGDEPTKAALREAIVDAAMRGLSRGTEQPAKRKNPLYVAPSQADAAWLYLYGTARSFVEWATDENIALAIEGLRARDDSQAGNIRAVRDCASIFTKVREAIDNA